MRRRTREMDGREGHESADTGGADRGVTRRRVLELGVGALAGLLVGLNRADRRAVTMEVGIQNSGLGLAILFTFFPQAAGMILIAGFWGVWHLVSGLALALIWSRSAGPMAKEGL